MTCGSYQDTSVGLRYLCCLTIIDLDLWFSENLRGFFFKNLYNELLEKIFSNVCSGFDAIYGNISMNKIRVAEIRIFM